MKRGVLLVIAVVGLGGFALGRWATSARDPVASAPAVAATAPAAAATAAPRAPAPIVRTVVREVPAAEPVAEPSAANLVAADQADDLVDAAAQRGRWSATDVAALRELAGTLTAEQLRAVLAELVPAINRGELTIAPELVGRPLF